jgi:hypothetical protein
VEGVKSENDHRQPNSNANEVNAWRRRSIDLTWRTPQRECIVAGLLKVLFGIRLQQVCTEFRRFRAEAIVDERPPGRSQAPDSLIDWSTTRAALPDLPTYD